MPWRRLNPTGPPSGPAGFATTTGEKSELEMPDNPKEILEIGEITLARR